MPKFLFSLLIAFSTPLALGGCYSSAPKTAESGLDIIPVSIATKNGTKIFTVEVARTDEEQQQGMMYRREMADDMGMLFPLPQPENASFWMRNTYISLDIIFIRADGVIARIGENTTPESEEPVEAGEDVTAVLEIKGGRSKALGIAPGDKVSWSD